MAFIQVSFMSKTLMRTVPLQVILPVDKFTFGQPEREEKPFKTLYLLHGIFGNETDWVHGTRIQRWAEEKTLPLSCRPARMRFMWITVHRCHARTVYRRRTG